MPLLALVLLFFPPLLFLADLDLEDFAKMGSHTGFSVGWYVGLRVDGKKRYNDGLDETDGVDEGVSVGEIVGYRVGETVG